MPPTNSPEGFQPNLRPPLVIMNGIPRITLMLFVSVFTTERLRDFDKALNTNKPLCPHIYKDPNLTRLPVISLLYSYDAL